MPVYNKNAGIFTSIEKTLLQLCFYFVMEFYLYKVLTNVKQEREYITFTLRTQCSYQSEDVKGKKIFKLGLTDCHFFWQGWVCVISVTKINVCHINYLYEFIFVVYIVVVKSFDRSIFLKSLYVLIPLEHNREIDTVHTFIVNLLSDKSGSQQY